jgi:hypothetical protein
MNAAFLPPAYSDAHSLLKILADPAAAQKRLDELGELAATAGRLNAETSELAKQVAADRAANKKQLDELARAREGHAATLKLIADARLDQREATLKARESKVAEAEKNTAAALADAAALKSKWEKRMDRLKAVQVDAD